MLPLTFLMAVVYVNDYQHGEEGFLRTEARANYYQYWHPDQKRAAEIIQQACQNEIYYK